jgi:hypothetical protein
MRKKRSGDKPLSRVAAPFLRATRAVVFSKKLSASPVSKTQSHYELLFPPRFRLKKGMVLDLLRAKTHG